jgi:hypothetical protein
MQTRFRKRIIAITLLVLSFSVSGRIARHKQTQANSVIRFVKLTGRLSVLRLFPCCNGCRRSLDGQDERRQD